MTSLTQAEKHRQWLQRRKEIVEEHNPQVCTCYIFKPFARQVSCKNCEMCPGCEQHIKNEYWHDHTQKCRALRDLEEENGGRSETLPRAEQTRHVRTGRKSR